MMCLRRLKTPAWSFAGTRVSEVAREQWERETVADLIYRELVEVRRIRDHRYFSPTQSRKGYRMARSADKRGHGSLIRKCLAVGGGPAEVPAKHSVAGLRR